MNRKVGRALVVIVLIAFVGMAVLPLFLPTGDSRILPN